MTISFIIAYHNEPLSMLKECIESILALDLSSQEREIIVVDDGSKVSAQKSLNDINPDIRYIRQQNRGLSAARNNGISKAKGEYVQFVDSDDKLIPAAYNTIISAVREHHMDMLMFRFSYNEATNRICSISPSMTGVDHLLNYNIRAAAWCYIFRRDILHDLRFREGIFHEDALFTPQLIFVAKTLHLTLTEAYFYRQHPGTIMSSNSPAHITKRLDDMALVLNLLNIICQSLSGREYKAMLRCVSQQTMNYLYLICQLPTSYLDKYLRIKALKQQKLYPLPLKCYTMKYFVISLCTQIIR